MTPKRYFVPRPDGRYVEVSAEEFAARSSPPPPAGLGDAVAVIAQPIARALDRALGTDIAHCGSCAKRRAILNKIHL